MEAAGGFARLIAPQPAGDRLSIASRFHGAGPQFGFVPVVFAAPFWIPRRWS